MVKGVTDLGERFGLVVNRYDHNIRKQKLPENMM